MEFLIHGMGCRLDLSSFVFVLYLKSKLDVKIKEKYSNFKKAILQHDKANSHTAKLTRSTIRELNWELLPHPRYSLVLPITIFSARYNPSVDGKHFQNDEDLKKWLQDYIDSKPKILYERESVNCQQIMKTISIKLLFWLSINIVLHLRLKQFTT